MPDCGVRDTTPHAVVFTMTATAIYSHQHGLRTLTYKNTYTTAYTCSIFNQIKLVKCGTDGRLLLSGFQALVTLTLNRVIRPAAIVNGGRDRHRKVQFSEFKKPHDLDLGSGDTAYRPASLIDLYLHTKFH